MIHRNFLNSSAALALLQWIRACDLTQKVRLHPSYQQAQANVIVAVKQLSLSGAAVHWEHLLQVVVDEVYLHINPTWIREVSSIQKNGKAHTMVFSFKQDMDAFLQLRTQYIMHLWSDYGPDHACQALMDPCISSFVAADDIVAPNETDFLNFWHGLLQWCHEKVSEFNASKPEALKEFLFDLCDSLGAHSADDGEHPEEMEECAPAQQPSAAVLESEATDGPKEPSQTPPPDEPDGKVKKADGVMASESQENPTVSLSKAMNQWLTMFCEGDQKKLAQSAPDCKIHDAKKIVFAKAPNKSTTVSYIVGGGLTKNFCLTLAGPLKRFETAQCYKLARIGAVDVFVDGSSVTNEYPYPVIAWDVPKTQDEAEVTVATFTVDDCMKLEVAKGKASGVQKIQYLKLAVKAGATVDEGAASIPAMFKGNGNETFLVRGALQSELIKKPKRNNPVALGEAFANEFFDAGATASSEETGKKRRGGFGGSGGERVVAKKGARQRANFNYGEFSFFVESCAEYTGDSSETVPLLEPV